MSAGYYDIEIEQGANWALNVNYEDTEGATIDLSVYASAEMKIKDSTESTDAYITLNTGNGRIALAQTDPNISLSLSGTETGSLDFDHAVYDLEIQSNTGVVDRVLQGKFIINPEVTD